MKIDIKSYWAIIAAALSLPIAPPILADIIVQDGVTITNTASIVVKGGSVSAGAPITGSGTVILAGTDTVSASGTISNLNVKVPSIAAGNLIVHGTLTTAQNLDLNGKTIDLGTTGTLVETSGRVFGDSGTVSATRDLPSGTHSNIAGLGISLSPQEDMGTTVITRGHSTEQIGPLESEARWYSVAPGAEVRAGLVFVWHDDEVSNDESGLRLYRSSDSSWDGFGGTVNTASNSLNKEDAPVSGIWRIAFNRPPELTAITALVIAKNEAGTIGTDRMTATDADGDPLTLVLSPGANYSLSGTTITPTAGFTGTLTVNAVVTDGMDYSDPLPVTVIVRDPAVNGAPVISTVAIGPIEKNRSATIDLSMINYRDEDNDPVLLIIGSGSNYKTSGNTITPAADFLGELTIPFSLTDGLDTSAVFNTSVTVFEKVVDFHKGQVEMKGLHTVVVTAGPNPAPVGARAVKISSSAQKYDRMEVKIYNSVAKLVSSGNGVVTAAGGLYEWPIAGRNLGGSYLAIVKLSCKGVPVDVKRIMIGVKR